MSDSNQPQDRDLKGQTVRGGLVTGLAQGVCAVLSLAAIPALARLLDPADFGLIAMVAVFTNFARMLVDAGLAMATVQRRELTEQQITNLFWTSLSLGVAVMIALAIGSPLVAWLYGEPRLQAVMAAMSVSYLLAGLTIQHQALLRRHLKFRALAAIQVCAVASSQLVALGWAYARSGKEDDYWALVFMPIAAAAVTMVGCWVAYPWAPSKPRRGAGTRELVEFGAGLTGFNLLNYFARQSDKLMIGWRWGEGPLGYYDRAYRLFLTPVAQVTSPMSAVALPALSRLTADHRRFESAYSRLIRPALLILTPLSLCFFVHADTIVDALLGPGWEPSKPIFRCLAIVGMIQPFSHMLTWVLIAFGQGKDVFRLGMLSASIKIIGYACGLPWGPRGVAISYAIVTVLIYTPIAFRFVSLRSPISLRPALTELANSQLVGAAVVSASLLVFYQVDDWSPAARLIMLVTVSALVWECTIASTRGGIQTRQELLAATRLR